MGVGFRTGRIQSLGDQGIRRAVWSRGGKPWLPGQNLLALCFLMPDGGGGLDTVFIL